MNKTAIDTPPEAVSRRPSGGSRFNKDQQQAINHLRGPAMVIAGPGSGKTTVITNRVKQLIDSGTARPQEILVISFTAAAAAEMKSRYLKLCSDSGKDKDNYSLVTFGTFHSVFYHFLKGIPEYSRLRLADPRECTDIIKHIVKAFYPDNRFTSDYYTYLLNRISVIKNTEDAASFTTSAADIQHKILHEYRKEMMRNGLIDFDDMLVLFYELMNTNKTFQHELRQRFRFIMIDEFQDINRIQFDAVRLLAAPLNNLFVVGDDDQSIYAFRGSDPSIMLKFKEYYENAAFIELFTNYRSSERIIRCASRLIRHNKARYEKQFNAINTFDAPVSVHSFRSPEEEAAYIVSELCVLPDSVKTVGILYRTHRTGAFIRRELFGYASGANYSEGARHKEISFMSFHASKGLEFDAVYIISANEGITPSKSAGEEAIEEERRLFYVAMTRAKQILHISNTAYIYNKSQNRSRFVGEALGIKICVVDFCRKLGVFLGF